ncbi:MAG TPA: HAMP domain-containing protein, partial [Albitalea sp.]|nr:HAMP domain-containing protein [Albitalea sp.]
MTPPRRPVVRRLTQWLRESMGARVVALFLGLLLLVQLASYAALQAGLAHHAGAAEHLPPLLAAVTLAGFVLFGLVGAVATRRMTTPLRELAAAADRLRAGDYTTPMDGVRRSDEIGHLANAFEQMRVSVADKQQQILQLAYWDSLTGLPNRAQFRDAVHEAIRGAAAGSTMAVIMLDLDRVEHVNAVLGYRFGDQLL